MRNDVHRGKVTRRFFFTQPAEGSFELGTGELRVGDDPVRLFERRGVLGADDRPVEGDVGDDLQSVPMRAEEAQVVLEEPEVVQDENDVGVDVVDEPPGLERREDVAAFRVGRVDRQAAIANDLARVADPEIVNLVPVRQPAA